MAIERVIAAYLEPEVKVGQVGAMSMYTSGCRLFTKWYEPPSTVYTMTAKGVLYGKYTQQYGIGVSEVGDTPMIPLCKLKLFMENMIYQ